MAEIPSRAACIVIVSEDPALGRLTAIALKSFGYDSNRIDLLPATEAEIHMRKRLASKPTILVIDGEKVRHLALARAVRKGSTNTKILALVRAEHIIDRPEGVATDDAIDAIIPLPYCLCSFAKVLGLQHTESNAT